MIPTEQRKLVYQSLDVMTMSSYQNWQIFEKVFQTASSQSPKKWGNIKNKRKKRIIAKMRKNENFLEEYPVDIIHLCRQTVRQWGRISQEMQFIDLYPINFLNSSEMKNLMFPWCFIQCSEILAEPVPEWPGQIWFCVLHSARISGSGNVIFLLAAHCCIFFWDKSIPQMSLWCLLCSHYCQTWGRRGTVWAGRGRCVRPPARATRPRHTGPGSAGCSRTCTQEGSGGGPVELGTKVA